MGAFSRESDHLGAIGAAIDEVAEQDNAIVLFEVQLVQQVLEFTVTSMNVPNGDESAFHIAAVLANGDVMGEANSRLRECPRGARSNFY